MLKLIIGSQEFWNEETEEFSVVEGFEFELEHSLVSLSKWESKTKKPYLSQEKKTPEEILLYVECMIISPIYPRDVLARLDQESLNKILSYIDSSESATTFGYLPERKGPSEIITSELIYYWMVVYSIPFVCEMWHLNRLFSLIRIANLKNQKPKKMTKAELASRNHRLNEERKAKYGTSG